MKHKLNHYLSTALGYIWTWLLLFGSLTALVWIISVLVKSLGELFGV